MVRNVALIILFDEKNKILLQHRTEDAPSYPGFWGFFGGGIYMDETPEQAVRREAIEELNYALLNPEFILTFDYKTDVYEGKKYYYREKCADKSFLKLLEGQDMRWVTIHQALTLRTNDWNKKTLIQLQNYFLEH